MSDPLKRQWQLLRAIPREPQRRSTPELLQALGDEGHDISVRSLQRDLNALSLDWGFTNDVEGKKYYWYWPKGFGVLDVPGLDPSQALVFHMAKQHLASALPASLLKRLTPYFDRADQTLSNEAQHLTRWRSRVRIIGREPSLAVPDIPEKIAAAVHSALLDGQQLELQYRKRGSMTVKTYEASLHALVVKDGVIYGVVSFWKHKDLNHIAIHRIVSATVLDKPATQLPAFDVDDYIKNQKAFAYPSKGAGKLKLELLLDAGAAEHLGERPMAENQILSPNDDGRVSLKATVHDTHELRWWLLGYCDAIEVIGPKNLRDEMRAKAQRLHGLYSK